MSSKKCNSMIFAIGALGYGIIEVVWRGYTHWSMLIAGGMSFLGLGKISALMKKSTIWVKAMAGSALITSIEYVFGVIFNIILKKDVWDYSRMPFNISGQVCVLYSFFWMILSLVFVPFSGFVRRKLEKGMLENRGK